MNYQMYWKYAKYVLNHKKNVFTTAWMYKEYLYAICHDFNKFLPDEFIPYAKYFYGEDGCISKDDFKKAWDKHKKRTKHHWETFGLFNPEITPRLVKLQIIDWYAMSEVMGDTPIDYFNSIKKEMILKLDNKTMTEFMKQLKIVPDNTIAVDLQFQEVIPFLDEGYEARQACMGNLFTLYKDEESGYILMQLRTHLSYNIPIERIHSQDAFNGIVDVIYDFPNKDVNPKNKSWFIKEKE